MDNKDIFKYFKLFTESTISYYETKKNSIKINQNKQNDENYPFNLIKSNPAAAICFYTALVQYKGPDCLRLSIIYVLNTILCNVTLIFLIIVQ